MWIWATPSQPLHWTIARFLGSASEGLSFKHVKEMVSDSDWRLQGQERYLKGATLVQREYRAYPSNPKWDHDHCEFCMAKFGEGDLSGAIQAGYSTTDEYRWICDDCFRDFRDRFDWTIDSEDSLGENA
jgi:hypothetical protein